MYYGGDFFFIIIILAIAGFALNLVAIREFILLAEKTDPHFSDGLMWAIGILAPLGSILVGLYVLAHISALRQNAPSLPLSENAANTAKKLMDMPKI